MPEEAARVHGLTIQVLEEKNAPPFAEVGRQIADFLRGAELIIHNAKFDVGFLNMEFRRMGLPTVEELGCTVTDTLAMAREMFPGRKPVWMPCATVFPSTAASASCTAH